MVAQVAAGGKVLLAAQAAVLAKKMDDGSGGSGGLAALAALAAWRCCWLTA